MKSEVNRETDGAMRRRSFLMNLCIGISMTMFGGASGYALIKYLFPPGAFSAHAEGEAVRIPFSDLTVGSARIVRYKGDPTVVIRMSERSVHALSAACTHLGCIVKWDGSRGTLVCPCHAATFDINGNVIGGPAPRPLASYPVKIVQDEIIIGES